MPGRILTSVPVLPREGDRLSRSERLRLVAEVLWTYVLVRGWLLRAGLPHALVAARRQPNRMANAELSIPSMLRLGNAVEQTLGRLPFDSRCLIRSLVLTRILARRGLSSSVVFAARSKPRFEAHAWVEHAGVALLPTGAGLHRLTEM